jgi:putative transposase
MLVCIRWYAAYPLRFRHLQEMIQERSVFVNHAAVHCWALKILQVFALIFRRRKRPVGTSWRMHETYIKVAGQWTYLHSAVDKAGDTVDFLLTAKRDKTAARRYLERAINLHGLPKKITIEKNGANIAAIHSVNTGACLDIRLRQSKYLNNIVEQDRRTVKRITNPMLGFKSFWSAQKLIAEIVAMHMIKKGQLYCPDGLAMSVTDQFYSLAF